jgi:1-piperideine-2-carboxylate/1-pyrroline-2-carboxylate reductase [NAD(P)H]
MSSTPIFDAAGTARLIPFRALVDALKTAAVDYAAGHVASPERLVVPLNENGIMLSMPAAASDLAIHKLVNVCPRNSEHTLPTIHGQVMAFDADTGKTLFILDGPTVTGRRTAAMTMLGIETLRDSAPKAFLLIGAGTQSASHLQAIGELYPEAAVRVKGRNEARVRAFCDAHRGTVRDLQPLDDADGIPDSIDTVIALTTSRQAVYDEAPRADRLVIGVGAFTPQMCEIGARTLAGSALYVDDLAGSKHEAGDFIQAGIDWSTVTGINDALTASDKRKPAAGTPVVFKTVGCAAWDLAAGRVARATLGSSKP